MDEIVFSTYSEKETEDFASSFASKVAMGTKIALHGNLGAGKTVFSRGFARGLGISEPVASPTFTIMQEYKLEDDNRLYHLDMYRIADSDAALAFGLDEYIEDHKSIMLIEWSERIPELLPEDTLHVYIKHEGDEKREIQVLNSYNSSLVNLQDLAE